LRFTRSPAYRWVVLAAAFLAVFGALGFGRFGYSAVLPSMQEALGISSAAAGSLASWNLAGYTLMAAVGGVLAARFGPRIVITVGMVVTAGGMLLTGVSNGLLEASAARLLTGMGNGLVLVPSITLMAAWFDLRQLGLASSIVPTGSSLALVIVGPIVPRIIEAGGGQGWRLAWYFFAGVTICLALISAIVQRDRPRFIVSSPGRTFHPAAADLSTSRRRRAGSTSHDLGTILRSRYAWHLGLIYMGFGITFLIYFTFFQKRLISDLGYSGQTAGSLFLILGFAGLAGGVIWGSVSDRIGREHTIAGTLLLAAIAAFLLAWPTGLAGLIVSTLLFGSTGMVIPGLIGAACGEKFGPRLASASLGLVTVLVGVGQTIGPFVGGLLGDAYSSLGPAYLLSGGVFVFAAVAAFLLGTAKPPREKSSRHPEPARD
jgi:predicted MFS family arabinose efflux permease